MLRRRGRALELWTDRRLGRRPEFFALRPYYNLRRLVTEAERQRVSGEGMERLTYTHICSSVLSARGTAPKDSIEITNRFLADVNLNYLVGKADTQLDMLYTLMFHDLSTKAICIRTRRYEAFDLLPRLMRLFKCVRGRNGDAVGNHDLPFDDWIFPHDFGQTDAGSADGALMTYMDLLMNWQGRDFFLGVVGNASFTDAILDVLNNGARPIFSRGGFSIRLNTNPNFYMRFLFIVNQDDLEHRETANAVPLPLTDRLASVYIDSDVYASEVDRFIARFIKAVDPRDLGTYSPMKRENLRLEQQRAKGELAYERRLQLHAVSDCELLHDYLNHFHDTPESLAFAAAPQLWLQRHSPLRLVTDDPGVRELLRGLRSTDADVPKADVAFVVVAAAAGVGWSGLVEQRRRFEDACADLKAKNGLSLAVFEAGDAVPADFLNVETDKQFARAMKACRVSERVVTRYFCDTCDHPHPTLVSFKDTRPEFSDDFDVVDASKLPERVRKGGDRLIGVHVGADARTDWDALAETFARLDPATAGALVVVCPREQESCVKFPQRWRVLKFPALDGVPDSIAWAFPSLPSFLHYFFPAQPREAPLVVCGSAGATQAEEEQWKDLLRPRAGGRAQAAAAAAARGRLYCLRPDRKVLERSISSYAELHPFLVAARAQGRRFVVVARETTTTTTTKPKTKTPGARKVLRIGQFVCLRCSGRITAEALAAFEAELGAGAGGVMGVWVGRPVAQPPDGVVPIAWDPIPRPVRLFETREHEFSHTSIDDLVRSLRARGQRPRGVIATRSCMMERLSTEEDVAPVLVGYQKSSRQFEKNCRTGDVFAAANVFVEEDFRQVKCIVTKLKRQAINHSAFLIYHLSSNELPSGLTTTKEWPVFWIESVSVSVLNDISLQEIVDCCLNPTTFELAKHMKLLRVVVQKKLEDMTYSYAKIRKIEFPEIKRCSSEYHHLLRVFCLSENEDVPPDVLAARIPEATKRLMEFIDAAVVHITRMGVPQVKDEFLKIIQRIKHPTQFRQINLKQEFYLALCSCVPRCVWQTLKILLNSNSLLKSGDQLRAQIHGMFKFVQDSAQWLPQFSQIDGRVWRLPGAPTFFPDLVLSLFSKFFSPLSYCGPLAPVRQYLDDVFTLAGIRPVAIEDWVRQELSAPPGDNGGLDPAYKFGGADANASPFDHFFSALLRYRPYGFHVKDAWPATEPAKKRKEGFLSRTFARNQAFEPADPLTLGGFLTAHFHGALSGDWCLHNPKEEEKKWVLALRPLWQFRHSPNEQFAEDVDDVRGINFEYVNNDTLSALLVTDSVTFPWQQLGEFVSRLSERDRVPLLAQNHPLQLAWTSASRAAEARFEFEAGPPSLAPFTRTFADFFGIRTEPAPVWPAPRPSTFADAISAFCARPYPQLVFAPLVQRARKLTYPSSKCLLNGPPAYVPILDLIRDNIAGRCPSVLCPLAEWLFVPDCPLLARQLLAVVLSLDGFHEYHDRLGPDVDRLRAEDDRLRTELEREAAVLSLLLNPWGDQTYALDKFWECVCAELNRVATPEPPALVLSALHAFPSATQPAILGTRPFIGDKTAPIVDPPPIERALLNVALFNFGNSEPSERNELLRRDARPSVAEAFRLLRSIGRVHWTQYLSHLSEFGEALQTVFSEQLNLGFLVLAVLRCGDLRNISLHFFGAEWARALRDVIHNRHSLSERLKQPAAVAVPLPDTAPADAARLVADLEVWRAKMKLPQEHPPPVGDPAAHFHVYADYLCRRVDELELFARGGHAHDGVSNNEALDLWFRVDALLDVAYDAYRIPRPLVALFARVEADFPEAASAHEQLSAFARVASELHNAATVCTEIPRTVPAKGVCAADLHWNVDCACAVSPFVALVQNAGTPAARVMLALRPVCQGTIGPITCPLAPLSTRLEAAPGEDFMGFDTVALAASLFEDVARNEWMARKFNSWKDVGQKVNGAEAPLAFFLLAWLRLCSEVSCEGDETRGRCGVLAFLMAVFAEQRKEFLEKFCPAPENLMFEWWKCYFWKGQRDEWKSWVANKSENWKDHSQNPAAPRIGAFKGCKETLMRLARTARMEENWELSDP
jgi:hypothetical protein